MSGHLEPLVRQRQDFRLSREPVSERLIRWETISTVTTASVFS